MAKVVDFKVEKGQMFGGAGVTSLMTSRNKPSPSATNGLMPEELLAQDAERNLTKSLWENRTQSTEPRAKAQSK